MRLSGVKNHSPPGVVVHRGWPSSRGDPTSAGASPGSALTSEEKAGGTGEGAGRHRAPSGSGPVGCILPGRAAASPSLRRLSHQRTPLFTAAVSEGFLCPSATLILVTFCYP